MVMIKMANKYGYNSSNPYEIVRKRMLLFILFISLLAISDLQSFYIINNENKFHLFKI